MGKKAAECAMKFEVLKRSNVQHKAWNMEEDLVFSAIVRFLIFNFKQCPFRHNFIFFIYRKQNPEKIEWKKVAFEFYMECECPIVRNPKQCRAHWNTHFSRKKM